jgi:sirohydrochlorin ferrochelatase
MGHSQQFPQPAAQPSRPSATHVILLAHGSPAAETTLEFHAFVKQWADLVPQFQVHGAFLSVGSPTLAQALEHAQAQGAQAIEVVPLLLFSGRHLLADIPGILTAFRTQNPSIQVSAGPALALRPGFAEFMVKAWQGGNS